MAVETPRRGGAADRGGRGAAAGASGRGRGQAQGAAGVARLEGTPDAEADAACRRPVSFLRMIHHSKLPDVVVVTHWVDTEQATLTKAALFLPTSYLYFIPGGLPEVTVRSCAVWSKNR